MSASTSIACRHTFCNIYFDWKPQQVTKYCIRRLRCRSQLLVHVYSIRGEKITRVWEHELLKKTVMLHRFITQHSFFNSIMLNTRSKIPSSLVLIKRTVNYSSKRQTNVLCTMTKKGIFKLITWYKAHNQKCTVMIYTTTLLVSICINMPSYSVTIAVTLKEVFT